MTFYNYQLKLTTVVIRRLTAVKFLINFPILVWHVHEWVCKKYNTIQSYRNKTKNAERKKELYMKHEGIDLNLLKLVQEGKCTIGNNRNKRASA